jgi:hypothetical protein
MPNLTPRELYRILLKAGWGKDAEKAFKVVYLESTLDPTIINPADPEPDGTPGEAYGLFQIHSQHIKNLEKEFGDDWKEEILDPVKNAEFALKYPYAEIGWDAWYNATILIDNDDQTNENYVKSLELWAEARTNARDDVDVQNEANFALESYNNGDGTFSFAKASQEVPEVLPDDNIEWENPAETTPIETPLGPDFDPTNLSEPMSAFTNPNEFVPQFVRDGVSQETDPRQEAEFQPNFVR